MHETIAQRTRHHLVPDRTKILPNPLLYLSAFFEVSRRDYYDGLRDFSERGTWHEWLEYFLQIR